MPIYAIADLHLSYGIPAKPMNVFGDNWNNYENEIMKNWNNVVKPDDLVILPGDFSWATYIQDTVKDFEYLARLQGKKLLLKGNHDYWWTTIASMNKFLKDNNFTNIDFLFNSAYEHENNIIVGTRGWTFNDTENSEKMLKREINRLELSIKNGILKYGSDKKIICAMHYPPITKTMIKNNISSPYIELMKKYNVTKCIYGHLHGKSHEEAAEGNIGNIEFKLVSSDYLNFKLYRVY